MSDDLSVWERLSVKNFTEARKPQFEWSCNFCGAKNVSFDAAKSAQALKDHINVCPKLHAAVEKAPAPGDGVA